MAILEKAGKAAVPESPEPAKQQTPFQRKLEHLLQLAKIPQDKFPQLFADEADIEDKSSQGRSAARVKAQSWTLSPRDPASHNPTGRSLNLIGGFFAKRLGLTDIPANYLGFGYSQDEFVSAIDALLRARKQVVTIPAPGGMDEFKSGQGDLLCGSYVLYRYSLGAQLVISEAMVVRRNLANAAVLDASLYCFPTQNRGSSTPWLSPDSADCDMATCVEEYHGPLYRYGDSLVICTAHFSEDAGVRRPRTLFFQDGAQRSVHWGIVSGYSGILREPFAARVLAVKFRDEPIDMRQVMRLTKRMGKAHLEAANLLELLGNRIDETESALSVASNHKPLLQLDAMIIPLILKNLSDDEPQ